MILGSWGDIVFEVRADKVRTYDEYTRKTEPRWGLHETMGSKPRAQFGGPGLDEISVILRMSSNLGLNPQLETERLRNAADNGLHAPFIRNGRPESQGNWYIESIEEVDLWVSSQGVEYAEVTVIFREYF